MAGNQNGIRKRILFYVALLACVSISSCALLEGRRVENMVSEQGAREHLSGGQKALAQHDYQASLQEFEAALSLSGNKPPGDEALLYMGMVYGDPENPKRDYRKSIGAFQRLAQEYPQSNWAEPSRIWMESLEERERLKHTMLETLQDNERVERLWNEALQENERLKRLSNETAQENQKLKRLSNETAQENQKLKQLSNETAQENKKLKEMMEQSKAVDVEVEEKKKGQGE
ncbi:MAG: hypothetical protein ABSH25_16535 [Syntrophorhabdales bacterium]|jgi:tetratricopeptide (TPR) repeat protein